MRAYQPCAHCGGHIVDLADNTGMPKTLSKAILTLLKKLHKTGGRTPLGAGVDVPTTLETAQHLMQGVFKGYGGNFDTIAYNTPDYRKLAHLERNVYQFSGAKNWQMMRDLTDALRDGDKILPFKDFAARAQTILDDYNGTWLKTEYNAAVAGSQMASKWVQFTEETAKGKPGFHALLEYRTAEDDRVRESHAVLNGIIRPVDDTFWKTYYPPNGWNCRCTVIRLPNGTGKSTAAKDMPEMPDVPLQFRTNLAENGMIYPQGSAYYIGLPKEVKQHINTIIPNRGDPPK